MLTRFEYNIQTGIRTTITQVVYRNEEGDTIVLDEGAKPPHGYSVFTGDLNHEPEQDPEN